MKYYDPSKILSLEESNGLSKLPNEKLSDKELSWVKREGVLIAPMKLGEIENITILTAEY